MTEVTWTCDRQPVADGTKLKLLVQTVDGFKDLPSSRTSQIRSEHTKKDRFQQPPTFSFCFVDKRNKN